MTEEELMTKAITIFGAYSQIGMVQEECAELIQAINKYRRKGDKSSEENIIEEAVDVELMIQQLKIMFPSKLWETCKKNKLNRLSDLIKEIN